MRHSEKGNTAYLGENQLFGVDFRDFIQKEQGSMGVELASEFGLTAAEAKKRKKQIERS